jgi:hypothetical protein
MKAIITTGSYSVFGSGSSTAILKLANGKRIVGKDVPNGYSDNGFVGFVAREVNLYPKTKVTYYRATYPGSKQEFSGTWEELLSQTKFPLVKEL